MPMYCEVEQYLGIVLQILMQWVKQYNPLSYITSC